MFKSLSRRALVLAVAGAITAVAGTGVVIAASVGVFTGPPAGACTITGTVGNDVLDGTAGAAIPSTCQAARWR